MRSIYDMRENEIETARQICRERRARIVEAVLIAPLVLACAVAMVVLCAVM